MTGPDPANRFRRYHKASLVLLVVASAALSILCLGGVPAAADDAARAAARIAEQQYGGRVLKVEKKNGLTYLSWAWAWGEVKKAYPSAVYEVARDPQTDKPYFADPHLGIMVMTNVCIDGQSLEMWLPVMDGANKAMKAESYIYKAKEYN